MIKFVFVAIFEDDTTFTKTSADGFKTRLDFYTWICNNRIGKNHGEVVEIMCVPTGDKASKTV